MKYKPAILDCPICGEHIEGDMPVIAHGIKGCTPKSKCTCSHKPEQECPVHGISAQLNRSQME